MSNRDNKERQRRVMHLVHVVQEILRRWDPIGILPAEFAPRDEYDGYAHPIVSMVMRGCSAMELAVHLSNIRTECMGIEPDPERDAAVAVEIITALHEQLR